MKRLRIVLFIDDRSLSVIWLESEEVGPVLSGEDFRNETKIY